MSEWVKARGEAKAEFSDLSKAVPGYSYKDAKSAEETDGKLRKKLQGMVSASRDSLFPMIEAAYLEKDWDNAGALEDVMQWLDLYMLELGLPAEWNEKAGYRGHVKLIRSDLALLRNTAKLAKALEDMNEKVLHGKGGSVVRKSAQLKQFITDLLGSYKKRRHALGG
jgi:hypothetical protein